MRLYLIGYMGCGKSSIARKVARASGLRMVDTDAEVENREGAAVADIIGYMGEEYFRKSEREVLLSTAEMSGVVVSTGGGLPTWGDNMEQMSQMGCTIYLRRSPENILPRLSPYGRAKRPKFRGLNDEQLLAFMHSHLAEREPVYSQAAVTIECDVKSDEMVVQEILTIIENLKTDSYEEV